MGATLVCTCRSIDRSIIGVLSKLWLDLERQGSFCSLGLLVSSVGPACADPFCPAGPGAWGLGWARLSEPGRAGPGQASPPPLPPQRSRLGGLPRRRLRLPDVGGDRPTRKDPGGAAVQCPPPPRSPVRARARPRPRPLSCCCWLGLRRTSRGGCVLALAIPSQATVGLAKAISSFPGDYCASGWEGGPGREGGGERRPRIHPPPRARRSLKPFLHSFCCVPASCSAFSAGRNPERGGPPPPQKETRRPPRR